MAHGTRSQRVAERVRTELITLLLRSVRDPGVTAATITRVSMTSDLQLARIYYTVATNKKRQPTARALRRAHPYIRRELGQRLQLRHVPEIRFFYDESAEQEERIGRIFDEIEEIRKTQDQVRNGEQAGEKSTAEDTDGM